MERDNDPLTIFLARRAELLGFIGLLLPADLVEDCFQDCFVVARRKAHTFDPQRGSAMAWLCGIARNEARRLLRAGRRQRPLHDALLDGLTAALDEPEPDPLPVQHLASCMEGLSDRHRDLLHDRYGKGLSLAQLASRVGSSPGAVQVMLSRIRSALADCLRRAGVAR